MKINIISKKAVLVAVLLFLSFTSNVQAQDEGDIGFEDDVNDEAPIDSLIYVGLLGGILFGYRYLKNKQTI